MTMARIAETRSSARRNQIRWVMSFCLRDVRVVGHDESCLYKFLSARLQIVRAAGKDLRRVRGIAAAVPGEEAARCVSIHGVDFFSEQFAADSQTLFGIAERREKHAVEAHFSGDLTHYLHQARSEEHTS